MNRTPEQKDRIIEAADAFIFEAEKVVRKANYELSELLENDVPGLIQGPEEMIVALRHLIREVKRS